MENIDSLLKKEVEYYFDQYVDIDNINHRITVDPRDGEIVFDEVYNAIAMPQSQESPVCCEHPSIIFNPHWYDAFMTYGVIDMNGHLVCYDDYSHYTPAAMISYLYKNFPIDLDNYDKYYIPRRSGNDIPLLYAVPCGRCDLCRANKSNEYAFRATCETHTFPDNPLFITITYKDKYLPKNGVEVSHLQKFFKRLRYHLSADNLPSDFRYLAVGEYGAKSGRPHYHAILWNYPYEQIYEATHSFARVCHYINKSWLDYVTDDDGHRQYFVHKNGKRLPKMESKGMIKTLPVTAGCVGYITKYFRKAACNKLNYPNKTFLVSSRKNGGIGSSYIRSQADFVEKNQQCQDLTISVRDEQRNCVVKHGVSGYIKNILYPPKTQLLAKKKQYIYIRKILHAFDEMQAIVYHENGSYANLLSYLGRHANVFKYLRFFFRARPRRYYMTNFTYYKNMSINMLHRIFNDYFEKFKVYVNMLDYDMISSCNSWLYRRQKFFASREDVRVYQTYNISSRIEQYERNYTNYINRCTF